MTGRLSHLIGDLYVSADPIAYRSLLPYYALMFVVIVIWIIIGEELSQFGLLAATSDSMSWVRMAAAVMGTMCAPIAVLSWRMKQQVSVTSLDWKLHEREIEYSEFEVLLSDYNKAYSHLMNRIDTMSVAMTASVFVAAILLPFIIVFYIPDIIATAPYVFGFLLLPFGLMVGRTVYLAVPNDASIEFPSVSSKLIRRAVELLEVTYGLSWAGVRLSIGETAGYFTLRDPRAVGRIEGIESSAWIGVEADESGRPIGAVARVALGSHEREFHSQLPASGELARRDLENLVRTCFTEYVSERGSDEMLDGIMEDLGIQMTKAVGPDPQKTDGGDALISGDQRTPSDAEDDENERGSSHSA
ncbi:MAG: hypothetical protein C4K49_03380 [Candidatus Thorarchaeota archaeon]|nr:MAG: hypothetical protein C4K49_03380 [Candidatus Thorarchaeota archaeon]